MAAALSCTLLNAPFYKFYPTVGRGLEVIFFDVCYTKFIHNYFEVCCFEINSARSREEREIIFEEYIIMMMINETFIRT